MDFTFKKVAGNPNRFEVIRDGASIGFVIKTEDFETKSTQFGGRKVSKVTRWKFQTAAGQMFTSKWATKDIAAKWLGETVDAVARGDAHPTR